MKEGVYIVKGAVEHNKWAWLTICWLLIAAEHGIPLPYNRFLQTDCLLMPTRPIRIISLTD